eukprot:COSAG04_NODE_736_length_10705_cov_17.817273_1_plen_218_part_00
MVSSHTAPARIAPRPVWKKYWPESSEERHGVQEGAGCRSDAAEDQPGMAGLRGGALWWGGGQGAGGRWGSSYHEGVEEECALSGQTVEVGRGEARGGVQGVVGAVAGLVGCVCRSVAAPVVCAPRQLRRGWNGTREEVAAYRRTRRRCSASWTWLAAGCTRALSRARGWLTGPADAVRSSTLLLRLPAGGTPAGPALGRITPFVVGVFGRFATVFYG